MGKKRKLFEENQPPVPEEASLNFILNPQVRSRRRTKSSPLITPTENTTLPTESEQTTLPPESEQTILPTESEHTITPTESEQTPTESEQAITPAESEKTITQKSEPPKKKPRNRKVVNCLEEAYEYNNDAFAEIEHIEGEEGLHYLADMMDGDNVSTLAVGEHSFLRTQRRNQHIILMIIAIVISWHS